MSVRLTVWDGAGVIGGNKILLETDAARLFFDFGTTFSQRERYFEEYLKIAPTGQYAEQAKSILASIKK